jgi:DUF917 family protein
MWQITADDLDSIAIGAGILGTGGGGNPYLGQQRMARLLSQGYRVSIIPLDDIADDALVAEVSSMGAPTVGVEKLPHGDEPRWAVEALEQYVGRPIDALVCAEVGGINSITPLVAGALTGKPVLDADGMGRAFPELQMSTHFFNGVPCTPAALVDEKGNRIVFAHTVDAFALERFARDLCVAMGCIAELAMPVMTGHQVKAHSVRNTLTLAKRIGDAVRAARARKNAVVDAVLAVIGGAALFTGKLVDVQRQTRGGFARGQLVAEGLGDDRGAWLHVAFQNENLVAWRGDRQAPEQVVASVPDLICVIDSDSGEPITTEQLRYGLRVTVLAVPCSDKLRTPQALAVVGPAAFGYPDVTYVPLPKRAGQGLE